MRYSVAVAAACLFCSSQAHAIQQCKPDKNEPRICIFTYTENDIYEIWGAPGGAQLITLGKDEDNTRLKSSDKKHLLTSRTNNLVTLKYRGCMVEQPFFIFSVRNEEELRTYRFQIETRPRICDDPDNPPQTLPNVVNASTGAVGAQPDLKHMEHDDDLAAGGSIPYEYRFVYPADEKAKRVAAARVSTKTKHNNEAEILVKAAGGTGFFNPHYSGRGDPRLKPVAPDPRTAPVSDDGYTTTIWLAGNTPVHVVTTPKKPDHHCGPDAAEASTDTSTTGNKVTIAGTAQAYCLRDSTGGVYELWNDAYNPVGHPPDTGTWRNDVERVVKGSE